MKPQVQLWKPPAGAELLAVPPEMEQIRDQIIYLVANLMKLYGLRSVKANVSMLGPAGTTSPTFEAFPAFEPIRPIQLAATEVTVVRSIVPVMMAYGIVGMTLELDEKDKTDMTNSWGRMKGAAPVAARPEEKPPLIQEEADDSGNKF